MIQDVIWEKHFKEAKNFFEHNGHLKVPKSYVVNDFRLGDWIHNQRNSYINGELPQDRVEKLESIGMLWTVNIRWFDMYHLLEDYYNSCHNTKISKEFVYKNQPLGLWLYNQKLNYKMGNLSQERKKLLDKLSINWTDLCITNEDKLQYKWNYHYELAKEYHLNYGHLAIHCNYEVDGIRLGNWIRTQRYHYKTGSLSEDRIKKLEDIGMLWDASVSKKENDWNYYYSLAERYYEEYNNLNIPEDYVIYGVKLGQWLNSLRIKYKENGLSSEQIRQLEKINIDWNILSSSTSNMFTNIYPLLHKYYIEHGDLNIPRDYTLNGINLDQMLKKLRKLYQAKLLSMEEVKMLDMINMIWSSYHISQKQQLYEKIKNYNTNIYNVFKYISLVDIDNLMSFIRLITSSITLDDYALMLECAFCFKKTLDENLYSSFILYISGFNYFEISNALGKSVEDVEFARIYSYNYLLNILKDKGLQQDSKKVKKIVR